MSAELERAYPGANKDMGRPAFVAPVGGLGSIESRSAPQGIYAILAAPFALGGLVLLSACSNVAGLLPARGTDRRPLGNRSLGA